MRNRDKPDPRLLFGPMARGELGEFIKKRIDRT
jgi:hypothetical protein